jgi:putative oxidoreductase
MNNVTIAAEIPQEIRDHRKVNVGRRKNIVEVISALFILLLLYTALSKTMNIGPTVDVLKRTPFFKAFPVEAAWGVVIVEYLVAILLFIPRTRKLGLYSSLSLMIGFIGYIIWMKIVVPDLPCSCGGVISKLTWNQHLVFNFGFALLALCGILLKQKTERDTL